MAERARYGSLPDVWQMPPERGIDFEVNRLSVKVEGLEVQLQNMNRQMNELLRNIDRNRERDITRQFIKELTLPSFSGEQFEDAGEFLRDIHTYIMAKRSPEDFQPKIISNALKQRARVWFQATRGQLNNFGEFANRFRQEFMSDEIQDREKEIWKAKKYTKGSLLEYYYLRVGEANRFIPPYTEAQRNRIIIGQLPRDIQIAMVCTNLAVTHDVTRALFRADDARVRNSTVERENDNRGSVQTSYNNNDPSRRYQYDRNTRYSDRSSNNMNNDKPYNNDRNRNFNRGSQSNSEEKSNPNALCRDRNRYSTDKNVSAVLATISEGDDNAIISCAEIHENGIEIAESEVEEIGQLTSCGIEMQV